MATPIKATPVLTGKDARRFEENMRKAEKNPVSKEEYTRIMSVYQNTKVFNSMAEYEQYHADPARG